MLPLIVDTLSVAGRPGSVSGTEIFCSPPPAVRGAAGAAMNRLRIRAATSGLMAFSFSGPLAADEDVAVDRAEAQLGAAAGDARREVAVAAIAIMAPRAIGGLGREAAVVVVVIGVDLAVQGLEAQVGGEAVEEGDLDAAIDRVEGAAGGGIAAEARHHRAIDAAGVPGPAHALEGHRPVDVADVEAAADPAHPHLAAVHRAGDEIDVGRHLEIEVEGRLVTEPLPAVEVGAAVAR